MLKDKIMKFMEVYYPYSESMCIPYIHEDAMEEEEDLQSLLWLHKYLEKRYEAAKEELLPELYYTVLYGEETQMAELGCTLDGYNQACIGKSHEDILKYTRERVDDIIDNFLIVPVEDDGTDKPYQEFLRQFNEFMKK